MDNIICYEIVTINKKGITLKTRESNIYVDFGECVKNFAHENSLEESRCVATRDITNLTFTFYTDTKVTLVFKRNFFKELLSGKTAASRFLDLKKDINNYGYTTYDLS